jgi:hypothetical protein
LSSALNAKEFMIAREHLQHYGGLTNELARQ